MPPQLLLDLDSLDLTRVVYSPEAIEAVNPHRYEFRLLDGIVYHNPADHSLVAFKDARADDFWVRGHIPGRPLFPGVLMIEAAAQAVSFAAKKASGTDAFFGFSGIDEVKFRHQVVPGDRLYIIGQCIEMRSRRFKYATQGVVGGKMAFEAIIVGMPI